MASQATGLPPPEGSGKLFGLILHGLLFVLLVGFLMRRVSFYGDLHPFATKTEVHRQMGGELSEGLAAY